MYDYSARINEITDTRRAVRLECDRLRRVLGDRYVSIATDEDAESGELLRRFHSIKEQMERSSSALERMIRIDERQSEIRLAMKELQRDLEQKESGKGLEGTYEAVGSAAFRLFREHPLVDATYSSVFSGLARYQDEIRRIDTRLEKFHSEPKTSGRSFFEKISRGGRDIVLRNRRSVKENQLPGLLQKLGRDLADTDFIDAMDDQELNEAAEPLRDVAARKQELRSEIDVLSNESRQLVEEFNTLSGGTRLAKAQRSREDEIAESRTELNSLLLSLGSAAERLKPEKLSEELGALADEESRRKHFDLVLTRLQAGRKAQLLREAIQSNSDRSAKIDATIAQLTEEKAQINGDTEQKEQEHTQLIEERGDESELFDT